MSYKFYRLMIVIMRYQLGPHPVHGTLYQVLSLDLLYYPKHERAMVL